jgi:isopentenyl diphosphate isomerase/L-lactate dehydrogenase-like FMN-dependent dehydrogenase
MAESSVERFTTTTELVAAAGRRLPAAAWDYLCGGAESETTVARNRRSLDAIAFRPRVLRHVETPDAGVELLGLKARLPVLLAPLGGMTQFHAQGALPAAQAACDFGCPMLASSVTEPPLERIAEAAGRRFLYQLYVHGDERWVLSRVRRAVDAGCAAFCLTVDAAHYGRRERSLLRRHSLPGRPFDRLRPGEEFGMRLDWSFVERLKSSLPVPLMIKGIATAEDAALAVEHGVDWIYVSNHGGRQLDHGLGAMDILPEIRATVRGRARIAVDGGFTRGTDVLKALAMGADCVGIGRLQALALAAAGREGVLRMLELLETELHIAMKLLGIGRLGELDGDCLQPGPAVGDTGLFGALPLLDTTRA